MPSKNSHSDYSACTIQFNLCITFSKSWIYTTQNAAGKYKNGGEQGIEYNGFVRRKIEPCFYVGFLCVHCWKLIREESVGGPEILITWNIGKETVLVSRPNLRSGS